MINNGDNVTITGKTFGRLLVTITDTHRLDFLERAGSPGLKWIARPSVTGRGYRVHQCPRLGEYDTAREAIDAAIETEDEREEGNV